MAEIGFIGMGNMGLAILHGLLKTCEPGRFILRQLMQKRWLRLQKLPACLMQSPTGPARRAANI